MLENKILSLNLQTARNDALVNACAANRNCYFGADFLLNFASKANSTVVELQKAIQRIHAEQLV